MSVLIKGMEMPKNCAECERWSICKCLNDYEDYESILYAVEDGDLVKADGCPLVEIPTPHGRLGDLDELIEKYGEWYTEEGTESGYIGTMKNLLDGASTVIEAEE